MLSELFLDNYWKIYFRYSWNIYWYIYRKSLRNK